MTPSEARQVVAQQCFSYMPETAAMAEAQAAKLLAAQADADWPAYRAARGAMKRPRMNPTVVPQTLYYDAPLLGVMEGEMKVAEIRDAFKAKHPKIKLPRNLSMALLRLLDRGLATRRINDRRIAIWRKTDQ